MTSVKTFHTSADKYRSGPYFPNKTKAIQIFTGRKSFHSKPSKEELATLHMTSTKIDMKNPRILREPTKRGRKSDLEKDQFGCVSEQKLAKILGNSEKISEMFNYIDEQHVFKGKDGSKLVLSDNFFVNYNIRRILYTTYNYSGVIWNYCGRDKDLNMLSYYPL